MLRFIVSTANGTTSETSIHSRLKVDLSSETTTLAGGGIPEAVESLRRHHEMLSLPTPWDDLETDPPPLWPGGCLISKALFPVPRSLCLRPSYLTVTWNSIPAHLPRQEEENKFVFQSMSANGADGDTHATCISHHHAWLCRPTHCNGVPCL